MFPNLDINLDLIRCFLTVVESGGVTQASKRLHVTQSGITLKIKRLEENLKCKLFKRTVKPLELSAEGEVVLFLPPFFWTPVSAVFFMFNCSGVRSPQVIDSPESCGACSGCRWILCIRKLRAARGPWTSWHSPPEPRA